jgi:hypothetical protein
MIAEIKTPKEWSLTDWATVISMLGLLMAAAWWMSALYSNVTSIRESLTEMASDTKLETTFVRSTLSDHERRIIVLENTR